MLAPALILLLCFGAGTVAAGRWLPDLALGRVGGMAFFAVCGLLGVTFGLVGLHVYEIVRLIETQPEGPGLGDKPDILASGLLAMQRDAGTVFGLAAAVYLLAPTPEEQPAE
jgi:hypothetical protein